jgi:D-alanine transaminase
MAATVYLNGRLVPAEAATVPLGDRGLLFGDGVYEVYRTYGGRPFRRKEHLERLRRSAAALRIAFPEVDWAGLHAELLERNGLQAADATVYIQLTRGAPAARKHAFPPTGTPPTLFVLARPLAPLAPELLARGVAVITRPDLRWGRCDIKSVNLLPNVLANQDAVEAGAWEAVFVRDGLVTEGTHTNVFAVVGGRLRTHPEGPRILGGITRTVVLQAAAAAGLPVDESPVAVAELARASEVLLSGTTAEVLPVTRVDGTPVGAGTPGPVARRLLEALRALTR